MGVCRYLRLRCFEIFIWRLYLQKWHVLKYTLVTVKWFGYLKSGYLLPKIFQKMVPYKGQTKSKKFLQSDISSKKRTNKFKFTTMKPQVVLFSFVNWRKLNTPKRHFETNQPLPNLENGQDITMIVQIIFYEIDALLLQFFSVKLFMCK